MSRQYDAVIIGSGQAGGPLSTALAGAGRTVALIERRFVGGTCINDGCTPTKTMVASARVAYLARRSADYGVQIGATSVDMQRVRQRKRDIVTSFRNGSTESIRAGGVDIIMGEATFTGPKSLRVVLHEGGTLDLSPELIVVDTGTSPYIPPVPGLDGVPHLDSTSIMELDEVPEHLLILGGGYIGLEFGQMFRRFGSEVTIVEHEPGLLGREDPEIAQAVTDIFREDGIAILTGTSAVTVSGNEKQIEVTARSDGGEHKLSGSHLLVAVGRRPNSGTLNLDAAGIAANDHGYIKVDEKLATSVDGVYAVGEVAGTPPFTHMVYDDFRILRDNLLKGGNRTTADRLIPYVLFIDPQLGRVGLTEKQARKQGHSVAVATVSMSHVARALETDETRGLVKAVVDTETEHILGCSILGLEGGELMAIIETAMLGKAPYTVLREAIWAHPTLAELFNTLFQSVQ